MNRLLRSASCALASCFYLTYPVEQMARRYHLRFTGAGFIGSLAGIATVPLLPEEPLRCLLFLAGCFCLSALVSDVAEAALQRKDDQRIVIDEWLGCLLSLALLPKTYPVMFAGFILFRVMDTIKPIGIRQLGRLPGGWGVIMDDVAAGLLVNIMLRGVLAFL